MLDNYEMSAAAFLEALAEFGIPATHDDVYAALRVSTDHAVSKFVPQSAAASFLIRYRELEAPHLEDDPVLFPGAVEVLAAVSEAGGGNYLVSHRNNQVLDILAKAGIADYFREVVTKDSGFPRKPDPAAFEYLFAKYGLPKHEAVAIGDRHIDIEAGRAAGIAAVYFDPPRTEPLATLCIGSLTDLLV